MVNSICFLWNKEAKLPNEGRYDFYSNKLKWLNNQVKSIVCLYLNNEIYSTKYQRSLIRKYTRYVPSHLVPHNRVGLHAIQQGMLLLTYPIRMHYFVGVHHTINATLSRIISKIKLFFSRIFINSLSRSSSCLASAKFTPRP